MDLSKILTVSGRPGLFRMISQNQQGIIAESLLTGKTSTIFAREPMSTLKDIHMYLENDGEISLTKVLQTIYTKFNAQKVTIGTSGNELRNFMQEIVPDFDKERVYNSDIQKLIKWYNLLLEKQLVDDKIEEEAAPESEEQPKAE